MGAQCSSDMFMIVLVMGECLSAQCKSNGERVLSVVLTVIECLSAQCISNGK